MTQYNTADRKAFEAQLQLLQEKYVNEAGIIMAKLEEARKQEVWRREMGLEPDQLEQARLRGKREADKARMRARAQGRDLDKELDELLSQV